MTPDRVNMRGRLSALRGARSWPLLAGVLGFLLLVVLFLRPGPPFDRNLPDFSAISDTDERKAAFFGFLQPYVNEANREILRKRQRIRRLEQHLDHGPLNRREARWVRRTAAAYSIDIPEEGRPGLEVIRQLENRIDIIPPSLALAQAALESGWGTSRFARQGNNLFGMWCYTPGCGIVPKRRPAGATYEVKAYPSPRESFLDYIENLNSNPAYASLREIRQSLRESGKPVTGLSLADGLVRYSQEGWTYIGKVKTMIRSNNLEGYDEPNS